MSADEIEVAAAAAENTSAMYAAMRQLKSKQWGNPQPKIERIQRERKARASVERIDGRSIRAGSERTEQLNVAVRPELKERLKHYCKGKSIKLTDWLEQQIMQALEGHD